MAKTPYIRDIYRNTSDSHQVSPGYVVTFLRWDNRDTLNYSGDPQELRKPLVVINDAVSVTVNNTKQGLAPTASIILKGGDLNYKTAVHPGDFVFINLLNWESDVIRVYNKAINLKPINTYGDGFKGFFKIQSVVKNLLVDPKTGTKTLTYTVTAAGFTEFNNVIYYNPAIAAALKDKGAVSLYSTLIGEFYQDNLKANAKVNTIVKSLFNILIGKSRRSQDVKVKNFGETNFKVPAQVGRLLGRSQPAKFATDIYNYVVGIWGSFSSGSAAGSNIGSGFNQGFSKESKEPMGNFWNAPKELQGNKQVFIENWNNATAWSIINQNINNTLNEIYTTYRVDPFNKVMPTVVVRQKPFTTDHYNGPGPTTKFMELPRWRVSSDLLLQLQTSKNDAARFNFVQVYTRAVPDTAGQDMALQIEEGNIVSDDGDIQRNGLRPYVVTSNFDFPFGDAKKDVKELRAGKWTQIVSDWIIDGHLKDSGKMVFVGLQDPISVGDNLEFDNVVYQIESVNHTMTIQPNGFKKFRTTLSVSYGMDIRSDSSRPVYADMEHTDAFTEQQEDFFNEKILPGIGDTQDIPGRKAFDGEEVRETRQKSFTQSPKPKTKRTKKADDKPENYVERRDDGGNGSTTDDLTKLPFGDSIPESSTD